MAKESSTTAVAQRRVKPSGQDRRSGDETARRTGPWPARWLLIPVVVAVLVWTATAVARVNPPATLIPVLVLVAAGVVGAAVSVYRLVAQRSLPPRRRRGIRRAVFALAAIAVGLTWLVPAAVAGPWTTPLLVTWGALVLAAVVLWSRTGWVRHRMQADRDRRAWPHIAAKLDIAGSVLRAIVWTRAGRSLHIELAEGQTWRHIRPDTADSVLGVAPGGTTPERDLTSARRVVLHVQDVDPWSGGPIPHPIEQHLEALEATRAKVRSNRLPTVEDLPGWVEEPERAAAWLPGSASVTDPLPIGERATGQPAGMPVYKPGVGAVHWLIGGQTGGGKSVLMRDLLAALFRCRDVVVWGIDTAKQGKAFGSWSEYMRVARTLEEAEQLLGEARAWVQASAAASAQEAAHGQGADNVEPSPERPMLVIVVDEGADIFDATGFEGEEADQRFACIEHAEKLGATGRSEAVGMVVMFQRPDGEVVPARLRTHFIGGICLRTKTASEMQFVLQGNAADDLDPTVFRHQGLLYMQDGPDVVPAPVRSYGLLDPELCARIATVLGPGLPTAPTWLQPDQPAAQASTSTGEAPAADPPAASRDQEDSNEPNQTTRSTAMDKPRRNDALDATRTAIEQAQNDLSEDLDAEGEVPEIDLAEVAAHHKDTPAQIDPSDQDAARALLQALTEAGDAGLERKNVSNHAELDEITTQRLLGLLERRGQVIGGEGVGPQVRWRVVTTTSSNGQHSAGDDTTGKEA